MSLGIGLGNVINVSVDKIIMFLLNYYDHLLAMTKHPKFYRQITGYQRGVGDHGFTNYILARPYLGCIQPCISYIQLIGLVTYTYTPSSGSHGSS